MVAAKMKKHISNTCAPRKHLRLREEERNQLLKAFSSTNDISLKGGIEKIA